MYIPEQFKLSDKAIIEQFVRENGFATLISQGSEYPGATHIPLELELNDQGEQILTGHMAKANPQWQQFAQHSKVTAVFLSDINHYISSSWYDHPNAPTWNYISVHISGSVEIIVGQKKWAAVKRLTDRYEQISKKPISLDTLPKAIQAEISQNRDDKNYALIINELRQLGDKKSALLADVMEKFRQ
jgi:transcriptional regulator